MVGTMNRLKELDKKEMLKDAYIEPKSPSKKISEAIWKAFTK